MMADSLATRAPESDLHETQPEPEAEASSESPQPAKVSDHCTTDRPLPASLAEAPSGTVEKWSIKPSHQEDMKVDVYTSKPADFPSTPARLLLLLTNGAGVTSPNNQHQADLFARNGYLVVMPDLFGGDPAPNSKPEEHGLESTASWLDTIKLKAAETAKSFMLDMWLARQTPEKIMPIIEGVLDQIHSRHAEAVSHGAGVYTVGYCFGGKYALLLAGEQDQSTEQGQDPEQGQVKKGPQVKASICAHGTMVSRDDLKRIRAPVQLVCVEEDPLFPADVLEEGQKWLKEKAVDHEVEVYPQVPHGFAVVGEYESNTISEAQSRAFDGMIKWLNAH